MASNALTRLSQRTPLRVKLITALLALLALALAIISFTSTAVFQGYLQHQADTTLGNLVRGIRQHSLSPNQQFYFASNGYAIEVIDAQGNEVPEYSDSDQLGTPPPKVPTSSVWLNAHQGKAVTVPAVSGGENWRVITYPVSYQNPDGPGFLSGTLVIGDSLGTISQTVGYLVKVDIVVSLIILLGLAVVSVAVVRTNLRPLDDIEETAQDIAAGHLDRRVPDRDPRTEVGRLGQSINTMLTQIETAFHAQQASEEAAVQSEDRMRRFIADASHELRTPLTAIRGFAEYYRQRGGVVSPEEGSRGSLTAEDLDRIMQRVEGEAARMGVLVEDLLLLARMDQQRPIEHRPVDLLVLAADAVQDTRMIDPGRPVRLDVEPGQAFLVNGDEPRLRQVISNLTSNALKYTPDGSPIDVRLRSGLMPGPAPYPGAPASSVPAAVLEVADQGPGLTPEQTQRVFERFYRADTHRNRKSGGSGLGLAIVSALVAAHGGTATVESEPGQGATFRVTLPLAPDAAASQPDQDELGPSPVDPGPVGPGGAESDTVSFGS
jgi:two-component system, OmpR family, sensor kinase